MQKLSHHEAALILGDLSMLKYQVLRLTEQMEQLPTKIAAEMERRHVMSDGLGRVNNPGQAKKPDPENNKH